MIPFTPLTTRRWNRIFILSIVIVLGTVYLFNFLIDPFGSRAWIVQKHFKPIVKERTEKYNYIFNQNNIQHFDCLILGSSRAMQIVPHKNPEIGTCYNFAVSMASNREKLFLLKEWLKHKKLSHVYLDVDFLNFHRNVEHPSQPVESHFKSGNEGSYLSHYTFKMAIKSLKNALTHKPETFFEPDGSINYYTDDKKIANSSFDFSKQRYIGMANTIYRDRFVKVPFVYAPESMQYLKEFKHICDVNNIQLTIFIPPEQLEATKKTINDPVVYNYYKRYKRDIVTLFGTVYDFSGNWPENRDQRNFYDVWHYRSILGDKMIKKFNGDDSFGTVLTQGNLSDYLIHFDENIR